MGLAPSISWGAHKLTWTLDYQNWISMQFTTHTMGTNKRKITRRDANRKERETNLQLDEQATPQSCICFLQATQQGTNQKPNPRKGWTKRINNPSWNNGKLNKPCTWYPRETSKEVICSNRLSLIEWFLFPNKCLTRISKQVKFSTFHHHRGRKHILEPNAFYSSLFCMQ